MRHRLMPLLLIALLLCPAVALAAPAAPQVDAEAAVLMSASNRKVLYAVNPEAYMYPASTTKIVTLLVALEKGKLDSVVTVSPGAANCEGSSLELRSGDKLTLRDLLYGLMLVSGNDAAEAVAEHVGGSIPKFAALMNAKADQLGATRTHFSNPHGLPDPINHFTTALDLAKITAAAMGNPEFNKIVSTREYTVNFRNRAPVRIANTNRLLRTYSSATGVKTGSTQEAGDCLVASARRGNVSLIAVLLNDDERWSDAVKLLDYGFSMPAAPGR